MGPPVPLADSQAQDAERTSDRHGGAPLQIHGPSSTDIPVSKTFYERHVSELHLLQPTPTEVLKVKESEEVVSRCQGISILWFFPRSMLNLHAPN